MRGPESRLKPSLEVFHVVDVVELLPESQEDHRKAFDEGADPLPRRGVGFLDCAVSTLLL